ncbi:MAG TPA: hypothetical protein VL588_05260, partial [Bdellovibrionota bacterium]|nr:hypothetical protein [Bdellovibrionota bacterium]
MPASPLNDQGNTALWRPLLLRGLEEDGWLQDWTTLGSVPADAGEATARWVAKAPGVWCASGLQAAIALVSPAELGGAVTATSLVADGQSAVVGQDLARWKGPARLLLALERPALNLAQYTCGIASATARLVAQVEKAARAAGCAAPRIVPTRKTLPHYRDLALFAVRAGGGHPHRVNLAGGVLIKENHVA